LQKQAKIIIRQIYEQSETTVGKQL